MLFRKFRSCLYTSINQTAGNGLNPLFIHVQKRIIATRENVCAEPLLSRLEGSWKTLVAIVCMQM